MVKMDFEDEERDIDIKDAAIVFREDGSLDVIIPSMDDDDTDTEVGTNVLVATALSGLICNSDQIKELIMYEIEQMLSKYPTMKNN